jgi:hypothetical protein
MIDEDLSKDTSSVATIDESEYTTTSYLGYSPDQESSSSQGAYDVKAVTITGLHKPQEVVVRLSAKLISRREQVRQTIEAIKHTSLAC